MKVLSYKYLLPNESGIIPELERSGYMTPQYINLVQEYLSTVILTGKVAFLYAAGVVLLASEARNTKDKQIYRERALDSSICIKELAAYSMHKWIGSFNGKENIQYANINANTCASSMFSLYEAEQLLNQGFDQVVIVAEEKTSYNTIRVFDEHKIDLKIGEGLAIIHLGKATNPADEDITNCQWSYEYNRNPFGVTSTGYAAVFNESDYINPHGTGTSINEDAESTVYGTIEQLRYKEQIGHTQGVSGLIEVCMILDENIQGNVLCVSSGLGGFYGSCIIRK